MDHRKKPSTKIELPYNLTAEFLAKIFIDFISTRYPTGEKLLKLAPLLGIEDNIQVQIIVFSQFRDAVRQSSPRLYQSPQHKDDVYMAILEGLEELEKILDEEEFEEEEESEQKEQDSTSDSSFR
jgi:type III secretion protein W